MTVVTVSLVLCVVTVTTCDSGDSVSGVVCCRCSVQAVGSVFHNACVAADYPENAVFAISWNTTKLVNITTQGNRCESPAPLFGDRYYGRPLALVIGHLVNSLFL